MNRPIMRLLCCGLLSAQAAVCAAAQAPTVELDVVEVDIAELDIVPPAERWEFSPIPDRRDIFYDLEQVYIARVKILELKEQADQDIADDPIGIPVDPASSLEDNLQRAHAILADVQQAMAGQRWDEALKKANNGIKRLTAIAKSADEDENKDALLEIRQIVDKLARYAVLAEEAKLLEEAKEEFAKLDLIVEGIMWSADERSLAIISGDTFAAQDRVKNTLIVNIDVNRVDFMFTYKGRRFEFQRYIGE